MFIKPLVAAIDVDQVTLDLLPVWLSLYNRDYHDNLQPKDITEWGIHHLVKPSCGKRIYDYLHLPELYEGIRVVDGAEQGIDFLRKFFRVAFVTASTNPWQRTALEKLGFLKDGTTHHVEPNKGNVEASLMVDDNADNLKAFKGYGLLFDAPHNQQEQLLKRHTRVFSWLDVQNYVMENYFVPIFSSTPVEEVGYLR